ncbi:hypothetical protein [Nodosilinea sp. P-1105]|uniref:hypothetical protein n=1 Tax=Nodosilinea sp. P-1105 TaxID=2546229 RepID=UPI00146CD471|nr:hypothetical protein [Nodosilinea sp. P-1105]NMF86134.1 hypothetical protein [Nodosilinea sp. P-1105]
MGSAERDTSKQDQSTIENSLKNGSGTEPSPKRPKLVSPPQRPVRPPAPAQEAKSAISKPPTATTTPAPEANNQAVEESPQGPRYQPIAPPSEPMQYRAIGLVRGTYAPTEADQLNRGNLTTDDGYVIDSVLLGRVTSLVKKHLDLDKSHLWVVYPRTRRDEEAEPNEQDLHLQIVGVWEPETLGLPGESKTDEDQGTVVTSEAEAETDEAEADQASAAESSPMTELPSVDDNFFSIRGEVVKYEPDDQSITVKIMQAAKRPPGNAKSFKLLLQGEITGRTVGYFWDFKVKREAKILVVQESSTVGIVPPKKRPKGAAARRGKPGGRGPGGRPGPSRRPVIKGSSRPRKPPVEKGASEEPAQD